MLLLGNVSLQDGVRLVDVALPASLTAALPGPRLGIAGVRALVGEPDRALLATALKPVGMTPQQLADLAYDIAAGGLHIIKEDQGLANQTWAPFAERVPRVAEAVPVWPPISRRDADMTAVRIQEPGTSTDAYCAAAPVIASERLRNSFATWSLMKTRIAAEPTSARAVWSSILICCASASSMSARELSAATIAVVSIGLG